MAEFTVLKNSLYASRYRSLPAETESIHPAYSENNMQTTYTITGIPLNTDDRDTRINDVKAALRETGRELKVPIKKITVVSDTVRFSLESTVLLEKVIAAIREMGLGVDVKPARSFMRAVGEKYGLPEA
jgi:hypothetical protein